MTTLIVSELGEITLQRELLKHLGVVPGQKIEVEMLPEGRLSAKAAPNGAITDFFGCLASPMGPRLSIEEINKIAADGWAKDK